MVKKWIIMLVIIAILVVGCVLESNYVNNAFIFLEESLVSFKEFVEKTPEEELGCEENVKEVATLHDEWHGKLSGLKCLIWHSGVKDVEVGLSRIQTYIKENDKTETLAELNSLIDYLKHYSEDFTITIENIL